MPLTPHWDLYVLVGYTTQTLDANANLAIASSTGQSTSFGLGASWKFGPRFAADIELLPRVAAGDGWKTDALNLGFHFQF